MSDSVEASDAKLRNFFFYSIEFNTLHHIHFFILDYILVGLPISTMQQVAHNRGGEEAFFWHEGVDIALDNKAILISLASAPASISRSIVFVVHGPSKLHLRIFIMFFECSFWMTARSFS